MTRSPLIRHIGCPWEPTETGRVQNCQNKIYQNFLNIHFVVRTQRQVHMQNFSQIGEVPWPTLIQVLQNMPLNKKLEDANYYGLRTIMNMGKRTSYESMLRTVDMNTLEHRRIEQSLLIFFKCFKENGPGYVANLFKPRVSPYNLRSSGLNVIQTSYNSRFLHGSYAYT